MELQFAAQSARSRRGKSCTVIMLCDVDHFKQVNDRHSHSTRDDVLRESAQRLQHSVRSYDMVGRFGGGKFLVILNKCDRCSAATRAENLRVAIGKKPFRTRAGPLDITISVGVATVDFEHDSLEEMLAATDAAMYAANETACAKRNEQRTPTPPKGPGKQSKL